MPKPRIGASKAARKDGERKRKRLHYYKHLESERSKALARFHRRRQSASPEEIERLWEQHRQAQARYTERHRKKLQAQAREKRRLKKLQKEIEEDEEEFERLMSLEHTESE
ncbi:hypothetical protein CVT26_009178 [Gymnopilus dilepis]|uniref:Uncharacterized protein n=1 Tax=Gymnopilus dilepis TaxID=231916 RepID=A0A409WUR0_9AGAR|nr:hypothetical protein CVT26_009178 [Gymnopilus dilepis]